jgi:hypothetical protein
MPNMSRYAQICPDTRDACRYAQIGTNPKRHPKASTNHPKNNTKAKSKKYPQKYKKTVQKRVRKGHQEGDPEWIRLRANSVEICNCFLDPELAPK